MADIVPAWMWRDPAEIIDRLLERSARQAARVQGLEMGHVELAHHDRYYTQARRMRVRMACKLAMRGER